MLPACVLEKPRFGAFHGTDLELILRSRGIDTIIYYGPVIFIKAGFQSNSSAIFGAVLIGLVNLIFTFVGIALVDRIGRKSLLLIGLTGMGISMVFVGLAFHSAQFVVLPVLTFIASFALSIGVVIWVYLSEYTRLN
jgi:MFS family permease